MAQPEQHRDDIDKSMSAWASVLPGRDLTEFEVALRVQRVSLIGRRNLGQHIPEKGVKPGDAEVLALLFESGPPFRLQPSKLAERCLITTGAMTGRTNRLEKAGLVQRVSSSADRRVMEIQLTQRGEALAQSMMQTLLESAFTRAISSLGKDAVANLRELLRHLENNLSA